jgi:hypothetical protein
MKNLLPEFQIAEAETEAATEDESSDEDICFEVTSSS